MSHPRLVVIIIVAIVLVLLAPAAFGQSGFCAKREAFIENLGKRYQESTVGVGIAPGGIVELLKSADGKTWSIILNMPDGRTCFVGSGQDWTVVEPAKLGKPL